jgi:methylated-DNA-protein-cysteine methyltransferase-like protein
MPHRFDEIFDVVRAIPSGQVMSYGQVARELNGSARMIGWAMSDAPEDVPWHRVVGSDGSLRIARRSPELGQEQRAKLEAEGVAFLGNGCVDMVKFGGG